MSENPALSSMFPRNPPARPNNGAIAPPVRQTRQRRFSLNRSLKLSTQLAGVGGGGSLNNSSDVLPNVELQSRPPNGATTPPLQTGDLKLDESLPSRKSFLLAADEKADIAVTATATPHVGNRSPRPFSSRSVLDLETDIAARLAAGVPVSSGEAEQSPGYDHGAGYAVSDSDVDWEKSLPSNNSLKTLCLLYMIGSAVITVIGRGVVFVFLGIIGIIFSIEGYYGVANYDKPTIVRVILLFLTALLTNFAFSVFAVSCHQCGYWNCDWSFRFANNRQLLLNCSC
jgi:hypothetical protein